MPRREEPPDSPPPAQGKLPVRYSKAKAKDFTDPRRHKYTARGGPIERRYVDPETLKVEEKR